MAQNGWKSRVADLGAVDVAADGGAAEAVPLHRLLELLGGEVRVLQGHRRERDEALRVGRARRRELLVLEGDDLSREIAVGLVPARVDAERLDVDALLVHRLQAHRELRGHVEIGAERRPAELEAEQQGGLGHCAVRVPVDGLDARAGAGASALQPTKTSPASAPAVP